MSTKMLYTTAYNFYWERYGERFENACTALEIKPDRLVIITDQPIDTKYENIVLPRDPNDLYALGKYRQKAYEICDCDWLVQIDIDDVMYPNYLNNLNDAVDWHIFNVKNNEGPMPHLNKSWKNFFDVEHMMPFGGMMNSALKMSALKKINGFVTDSGWEDLMTVCNLKFNDCTIFADTSVLRGERIFRNPGSITSNTEVALIKIAETQAHRDKLRKLYNEQHT